MGRALESVLATLKWMMWSDVLGLYIHLSYFKTSDDDRLGATQLFLEAQFELDSERNNVPSLGQEHQPDLWGKVGE